MTLRVGRYETLRAIASGGMATVYLGRAVGAGGFERLVALKVMHPQIASDPEFVAMFLDEARLTARVRHPNVVATIDLVEDPLFLVMEFIEGPSLHLLLRTCARAKRLLPIEITLRIFLDMLSGLHAAHELTDANGELLHLVHRDVSPQNVLVGVDGVSRITDFGVARAESRLTSTRASTLKGKLGYMPPEQIQCEQVDRRGDVYSAGVVLWEMLTGQRLFKADNDGALVAQILAGPPQGPRAISPHVPVLLDRICVHALQAKPHERFPTAAAFADAVEQAITGTPGIAIASSRALAALIKELGMQALPEQLTGPAMPAMGGSSPSSAPRAFPSYRPAPTSRPTPLTQPSAQMSSSFQSMGPPSATAIGALVSEAAMFRPNVKRRSVIAGAAAVAFAAGAVAFVAVEGAGQHPGVGSVSAVSSAAVEAVVPARAEPEAPTRAVPPAVSSALPDGGKQAEPPQPSPSAEPKSASVDSSPASKTARGSSARGSAKTSEGGRSAPSPRAVSPQPYRPSEL